jgi:formylglycine-generating enzyme
MDMIFVEGGTFEMGYPLYEKTDRPVHTVTVDSFYIGKYPVTQAQYKKITGKNPSRFKDDENPVEQISWYDAIEFCNKLSRKENLTEYYKIDKTVVDSSNQNEHDDLKYLVTKNHGSDGYRLPTEAEWEFASKGGNYSGGYLFSGSDDLDEVGWYNKNSDEKPKNVGLKMKNELGIYDMSGNVFEWCWDWFEFYTDRAEVNPTGPEFGTNRMTKGGSANMFKNGCRSSSRTWGTPGNSDNPYMFLFAGFRVARNGK